MKKVFLIYAVLVVSIIGWYLTAGKGKKIINDSKATALKVSKHSRQFNESIEAVMESYYKMIDDFTKGDTVAVNAGQSGRMTDGVVCGGTSHQQRCERYAGDRA